MKEFLSEISKKLNTAFKKINISKKSDKPLSAVYHLLFCVNWKLEFIFLTDDN